VIAMNKEYTRYEKARIISARVMQIVQGSPVLIKLTGDIQDPEKIAVMEWRAGVIPIDIKRKANN